MAGAFQEMLVSAFVGLATPCQEFVSACFGEKAALCRVFVAAPLEGEHIMREGDCLTYLWREAAHT